MLADMHLYVSRAYVAGSKSSDTVLYRFHVSRIHTHALLKIEAGTEATQLSALNILIALRQMLVGFTNAELATPAAAGLGSGCSVCSCQHEEVRSENIGKHIPSTQASLRQLHLLIMPRSCALKGNQESVDQHSIVRAAAKYIRKLQYRVQVMEFQNRELRIRTPDIAQSASSAGMLEVTLVGTDSSANVVTRWREVLLNRMEDETVGFPSGESWGSGYRLTCTYHHGNVDPAFYNIVAKRAKLEWAVAARRLSASHFVNGLNRALMDCMEEELTEGTTCVPGLSCSMFVGQTCHLGCKRSHSENVGITEQLDSSSPMDACLEELRRLIPFRNVLKGVRHSIVYGAVDYIRKLQDRLHFLELQNKDLQNLALPLDAAQSSSPAGNIDVTVMGITATINIFTPVNLPVLTRASVVLAGMHLHVVCAYFINSKAKRVMYRFYVTMASTDSMVKIEEATMMAPRLSALDILVALNRMLLDLMPATQDVGLCCSICLRQGEKVHSDNVSLQQLRLLIAPSLFVSKSDEESIVRGAIEHIKKLQYQIQLLELRNHELHNQAQSSNCAGNINVTVVGTNASIDIITRSRPLLFDRACKVISGMGMNVIRSSRNQTCISHVDSFDSVLYTFFVTSSKVKLEAAVKTEERAAAKRLKLETAVKIEEVAAVKRLSASHIVAELNRMLMELMEEEVLVI